MSARWWLSRRPLRPPRPRIQKCALLLIALAACQAANLAIPAKRCIETKTTPNVHSTRLDCSTKRTVSKTAIAVTSLDRALSQCAPCDLPRPQLPLQPLNGYLPKCASAAAYKRSEPKGLAASRVYTRTAIRRMSLRMTDCALHSSAYITISNIPFTTRIVPFHLSE